MRELLLDNDTTIFLRINSELKGLVTDAAKKEGVSFSTFLKRVLVNELIKKSELENANRNNGLEGSAK